MNLRKNPLGVKSFDFAQRAIETQKILISKDKEFIMSRQMARSATAVGAMIRESEYASSRADFTHKLTLALKEANETEYWLDLLLATGYLNRETHHDLQGKCKELIRMLVASIKTAKGNT
jgi:four helix bundle protein